LPSFNTVQQDLAILLYKGFHQLGEGESWKNSLDGTTEEEDKPQTLLPQTGG